MIENLKVPLNGIWYIYCTIYNIIYLSPRVLAYYIQLYVIQ